MSESQVNVHMTVTDKAVNALMSLFESLDKLCLDLFTSRIRDLLNGDDTSAEPEIGYKYTVQHQALYLAIEQGELHPVGSIHELNKLDDEQLYERCRGKHWRRS